MVLCFGTFARVLICCGPSAGAVTNPIFVGTMTQTVDPSCSYIYSPDDVSRLLACTQNLSKGENRRDGHPISEVIQKALEIDTTEKREAVVKKFKDKVVNLIDEDKKKSAILALLDIIRKDASLNNSRKHSFEKYLGATKEDLLLQTEYNLPNLLVGIFLYTVTSVKNKSDNGKMFVKNITEDYVNKFNDANYFWDVGSQTLKKIAVVISEKFVEIINESEFEEFMYDESVSISRVNEILGSIKKNILDKFDSNQEICKKVNEFYNALDNYSNSMQIVSPSTLEYYINTRNSLLLYGDFFVEIKKDRDNINKEISKRTAKMELLKQALNKFNSMNKDCTDVSEENNTTPLLKPITPALEAMFDKEYKRFLNYSIDETIAFEATEKEKIKKMLQRLESEIEKLESGIVQLDFVEIVFIERDRVFSLYSQISGSKK